MRLKFKKICGKNTTHWINRVCIGLAVLLLACNNFGKNKIGFLNWNGANEIARNTFNSFKTRANQLGIEVIEKDAHNNENEQYTQAMEMIDQGIKVLVIKPVNTIIAAEIVRKAHKKGVKVIANDQLIRNCELDYYITFDSQKVGEYMALEALQQKPKGNYLLLWGDKRDDNADLVKNGVLKILQPQIDNGNVKVLYQNYIENWSLENAEHEVDLIVRLSKGQKIDAIIAACDDMIRGAINILKKNNMLANTFTAGQNADLESLKLVLRKEQSLTIAKSPKTIGFALAELAAKLVSDNDVKSELDIKASTFNGTKEVPSILFDPVIIKQSNLEQIIIKDGFFSKEELYN
jgi:ABC-type xylose transport system substrate-binding protein